MAQFSFTPAGYDFINNYVEVHGGLTYGPDEDRWVGFDTNHAFDDWSDAELERLFKNDHPDIWAQLQHYWEVLGRDSWPPGRIGSKLSAPDPWQITWTADMVEVETNRLAEQIWTRHKGGAAVVAAILRKEDPSDGRA